MWPAPAAPRAWPCAALSGRGTLPPVPRLAALSPFALALATFAQPAGCARPDGATCRVVSERVLAELPRTDSRAFFVPGAPGERVALFFARDEPDGGSPLGVASGVEAVVLSREGDLLRRARVPAPARLLARRGSTEATGAVWAGSGVVWHWVERVTTTEPDGRLRSRAQGVLVRVGEDGVAGGALEPPELACDDCNLALDGVQVGDESVVLFVATAKPKESASGGQLGGVANASSTAGPTVITNGVVRVDARGAARVVSPLRAAALPLDAASRLDVIEERLYLGSRGFFVPVDPELRATGPFAPRPNPIDTALAPHAGGLTVAWTRLADSATTERSSNGDLALLEIDAAGRAGPTLRVSATTRVLSLARAGDRVALLHTSAGATWLSIVDAGAKVGADVAVPTAQGTPTRALVARSRTELRDLEIGAGRVIAREIACDP